MRVSHSSLNKYSNHHRLPSFAYRPMIALGLPEGARVSLPCLCL